jgi:thiocyanate desulfurase
MEEKQFTREEIHLILKEHAEGADTLEVCEKHGINELQLLEWHAEYGGNPLAKPNKLRQFMHQVFGGPPKLSRRELLIAGAAGTAGVVAGHYFAMAGNRSTTKSVTSSATPVQIVNAQKQKNLTEELGKYVYLTPQKLGGGTHAVDLDSGKTLAWISYWNFGDSCPISHHLAAYPSPDPYKGFEFVNSTQGGDNVMIYGLPTPIKDRGLLDRWGQGNHIYRVKFDGQSMNLIEDVAETTGIGLGVHITILPDASGFAAADGQKDICAFFNRAADGEKTEVLNAFRADWYGNNPKGNLEENWMKGGTLRIERIQKAKETNKFDYEGAKGNKINWEMVPMAENLVYTGQLPGDSPRTLTGLDAVVHHPGNRYSALIIRMLPA